MNAYGHDLWYTLGATFGVIFFIIFILTGILSFFLICFSIYEWADPEGQNEKEDISWAFKMMWTFIITFLLSVFLVVAIGVGLVGMGYWG